MMPAIISCLDEGKVWKDEQITYEEVYAYDSVRVAKSEELTEVFEQLHLHLRAHPEYFHK